MDEQDRLVQEARHYPLEFKSLSSYANWFIGSLDRCGLSINRNSLRIDRQGIPARDSTRKGKGQFVIGSYHIIEAPGVTNSAELGVVIEQQMNLKLRETIFVINGRLFLSSYAYHFELINEKRWPYFRYEKRPLPHENEAYAPLFHVHVAGRLPHMPAPKVNIKTILDNIRANLFDPEKANRLSDSLWSELAQPLDKNSP